MRLRLLVVALMTLTLFVDVAHALVEEAHGTSRLVRLVRTLESADPLVHADLAAIAFDAMIDAYEQELERIASPRRRFSQRERTKQWRWAAAARRFLDTIYDARQALDEGAPVELIAGSPIEAQILVGELLVPVTSPRINEPGSLEDSVIAAFCDLHGCDASLLEDTVRAREARRGGWSLRQGMGSTYITVDGLGFMFPSLRDRALKEELCQRAAAELREVVAVLKRADALGIDIDWDAMRVIHAASGGSERLVLDRGGRGSRVSAPILVRSPSILDVARPWLRARMRGLRAEQLFPRADLLFGNILAGT